MSPDRVARLTQEPVPRRVTKRVVGALEADDVEEHKREWLVRSTRPGDVALQLDDSRLPVQRSGEPIDPGGRPLSRRSNTLTQCRAAVISRACPVAGGHPTVTQRRGAVGSCSRVHSVRGFVAGLGTFIPSIRSRIAGVGSAIARLGSRVSLLR